MNYKIYKKDGSPAFVSEKELLPALKSGKYGFDTSKPVGIYDPSGKGMGLPPDHDNIVKALENGWRLESVEENKERKLQRDYGGIEGQAIAAALGAAKGLTFGLSDLVLDGAGKQYEEANPTSYAVGEVGSIVGSLLIPGGQANAAKAFGGLKLGSGVRAVNKLGLNIEAAVGKRLAAGGAEAGVMRQIMARGAGVGAGAAVEGGIYGAGEFISGYAKDEIEPAVENLVGNVGMGMLWGGVAGGVLGSSAELIRKGLGTGKAFSKNSVKGIIKKWETATDIKAVEGIEAELAKIIDNPSAWGKIEGKLKLTDPGYVSLFRRKDELGDLARKMATESEQEIGKLTEVFADLLQESDDLGHKVFSGSYGKLKDKFILKTVSNENHANVFKTVSDMIGYATEKNKRIVGHDGMMGRIQQAISLAEKNNSFGLSPMLKHTRKAMKGYTDEIITSLVRDPTDVGTVYVKLNHMKQKLGWYANLAKKTYRKSRKAEDLVTFNMYKEEYLKLANTLEDPILFGKKMTDHQRIANEAMTEYLTYNTADIKFKFDRFEGEVPFGELEDAADFRPLFKKDPGEVKRFLNSLGLDESKLDEQMFVRNLQNKLKAAKAQGHSSDLVSKEIIDKLQKNTDAIMLHLKKTAVGVRMRNQLGDIIKKSAELSGKTGINTMTSGMMGYMTGGPLGALAGAGLNIYTDTGKRATLMAATARLVSKNRGGVDSGVRSYLRKLSGKSPGKTRKLIAPTSVLINSNWGDKKTKDNNKREAIRRRGKELSEVINNPQLAADRLAANSAALTEVDQDMSIAAQVKSMQVAQYLDSKWPKEDEDGMLVQSRKKLTDVEVNNLESLTAVLTDITLLPKYLEENKITREIMKAVEELYPITYRDISTQIAEAIPDIRKSKDIPFKYMASLSIWFGMPVSKAFSPEFMTTIQSVSKQGQQPQQDPGQPQGNTKVAANAFRKIGKEIGSVSKMVTDKVSEIT